MLAISGIARLAPGIPGGATCWASGGWSPIPAGWRRTAIPMRRPGCTNPEHAGMTHRRRWMSQDPSGLSAGSNLDEYVGNDPINATDPAGLAATPGTRFRGESATGGLYKRRDSGAGNLRHSAKSGRAVTILGTEWPVLCSNQMGARTPQRGKMAASSLSGFVHSFTFLM